MEKSRIKTFFAITTLVLLANTLLSNQVFAAEKPVISVNFNRKIATINDGVFGQGLEMPFLKNVWDEDTGFNQEMIGVSKDMGFSNIRFGGNTCKQFNWKDDGYISYGKVYHESIDQWAEYAKLIGDASLTVCVNLHLSPQDSADMLRYANLEKGYNIVNWEMGNEEYLNDEYQVFNTAEKYVSSARAHCQAMKGVDPSIKCGIHTGTDFLTSGPAWSDQALFSAVKANDFDFLVNHNYQPNNYFNYQAIYSNYNKIERSLNIENGSYKIKFHAFGDQAPTSDDPIPTLKVCLNSSCQLIDITSTAKNWSKYSSEIFSINNTTTSNLTVEIFDDYYNSTTGEDKNIYIAAIEIIKADGSIQQKIELVDTIAWTYSFLASNLATEDRLDFLKRTQRQYRLHLPIYETEYGWYYGSSAYPGEGKQYDWRSGLFDGLHLQSMIIKEVPQANLWTDLATANWRYFSDDSKGKIYWPRYQVFKLMKEKTGDTLVKVRTRNIATYDAYEFATKARADVPFLSIIASKDNSKSYINVINRHQSESITATIKTDLRASKATVYEIAPLSIEAHPYRDDRFQEDIKTTEKIISTKQNFDYNFKPFSITTFEFSNPEKRKWGRWQPVMPRSRR